MIASALGEIVAEATAALDGLGVLVTDDTHEAVSSVASGKPVILVLAAPAIEWITVTRSTVTWTAWAIAPTPDPAEAVSIFDPILDTLVAAMWIDRAQPETYDIGDRTFPGYTLTFTTENT